MKTNTLSSELLLVGIASSAGGIPPLMDLIEAAFCHKNMAFIIVPHLSREHESHLPQILERVSSLQIETITEGARIKPCHLYVLPPGKYAIVSNHIFHLEDRPLSGPNKAADILFYSLAQFYQQNAIGVVLSGSSVGSDGSEGVCAIKSNGGHTYAQDPATAQFPHMPTLAIETGCIDSILSAELIGHELTLVGWATEPK